MLPGWFACVERFADVVVALDDGSTDDTAALLTAHPLVVRLLRNPVRPTYEGWDDLGNRNRLLEALDDVGADWVLSLDADERIDEGDIAALRQLVDGEGDPACGYCVEVHRMIGDDEHFDKAWLWVGRIFAHRRGQRFDGSRLHFVALPADIPPERRWRTTIRLKHLGDLDAGHRQARFAKYGEADPERRYQADYANLLEAPADVRRWERRPPLLPLVVNRAASIDPAAPPPAVTVPPEGDVVPGPGALAAAEALHRAGWAMVTGPVENATPTPTGWAAYFLGHAAGLPGRSSGPQKGPPSWCTYLTEVVDAAAPAPDALARNRALFRRGYGAYRSPDVRLVFHSPAVRAGQLLRRQFQAGRPRAEELRSGPTSNVRREALLHGPRRLRAITGAVVRWGGGVRGRFLLALPLVTLGATAEAAGVAAVLVRDRKRHAGRRRRGRAARRSRRAARGR